MPSKIILKRAPASQIEVVRTDPAQALVPTLDIHEVEDEMHRAIAERAVDVRKAIVFELKRRREIEDHLNALRRGEPAGDGDAELYRDNIKDMFLEEYEESASTLERLFAEISTLEAAQARRWYWVPMVTSLVALTLTVVGWLVNGK